MPVQNLEHSISLPAAGEPRQREATSRPSPLEIAAGVQALALIVLLATEGSAVARLLRIGAVLLFTTLGILVMRRAGSVGRGSAALVLGIAGTVAGAGIGGVYAAKVGVSVMTIAGLVGLTTGVALLIAGAVTLIRQLRGWWRLASIPAALALLAFVLYPLTVAVNATNRPAAPLGTETPADRGLAYEVVSFRTSDDVRLSAWYVPSRNGAAVVLLHGAGSSRSSVLAHGTVLADHGSGVLLLDRRGHGTSEGDAMDFGWYGDLDIGAAISFLQARADVSPAAIGVVGLSMGGEQAIAAAGVDGRIGAVVAEGVTGMQSADHGWLERYGIQASIQLVIDQITYGAAGVLSGAERPMSLRDAVRAASPRPVLLIACGATTDEAVAGRWFRQASPGSVELWVVPGAGHTAGLATQPDRWEGEVVGFLDAVLLPDASSG
jgi:fermentation-respiration switch protein FrsA (DUF1100 family)